MWYQLIKLTSNNPNTDHLQTRYLTDYYKQPLGSLTQGTLNMANTTMQFKGKIKKREFEEKIIDVCGEDREISSRINVEEGKRMTLYYINGAHAGTWQSGGACIYSNETIESHIASKLRIQNLLAK